MNFTNNDEFKNLLRMKQIDIQQRTSDGIQETAQFQRMKALLSIGRMKYEETDYRLVIIAKENLKHLAENANILIEELFQTSTFITNRTVVVDSELQIVNANNDPFPEDNNEARRFFTSVSKGSNLVCFLIDPDSTINYFIDGNEYGDGIFYSNSSRKAYEKLKTIDKLEEVLEDYRNVLTHQDTYVKFFVPKSQLLALKTLKGIESPDKNFIQENKHLLRNRPEECLREDIRNYIKKHMKVVVHRELMLEDLDRLDIELFDETGRDLYFLEIKWVGNSIHANGDDIGTTYNARPRIVPDAIIQVLKYIRQLSIEKENIKQGYLIVFDALPTHFTSMRNNCHYINMAID